MPLTGTIPTELRHSIRVFSWDNADGEDDVYGLFTFNFDLDLILTFSQGCKDLIFFRIILLTGTTLYSAHLIEPLQ